MSAGCPSHPLAETIRDQATALRAQGAARRRRHRACRRPVFELRSAGGSLFVRGLVRDLHGGARPATTALSTSIVAGHVHASVGHLVEGIAITEAFSGGPRVRPGGPRDRSPCRTASRASGFFAPRDLCAREDPKTLNLRSRQPRRNPGAGRIRECAGVAGCHDRTCARAGGGTGPGLESRAGRHRPRHANPAAGARFAARQPLHRRSACLGARRATSRSTTPVGAFGRIFPRVQLTYGSVYEVMPFDNLVVPLRLTGKQLRDGVRDSLQSEQANHRLLGHPRARTVLGRVARRGAEPSFGRSRHRRRVTPCRGQRLSGDWRGRHLAPVIPPGGFPSSAPRRSCVTFSPNIFESLAGTCVKSSCSTRARLDCPFRRPADERFRVERRGVVGPLRSRKPDRTDAQPASVKLPVATRRPSAVTSPSILYIPPRRPVTRARASSMAPGPAALGNLNGPMAATRSCNGWADAPSPGAAAAMPPVCASISMRMTAGTIGCPGKSSLKVEVVGSSQTAAHGPFPGGDVDDFVQQPHRRPVREVVYPGHRGPAVYWLPPAAHDRRRARLSTITSTFTASEHR